MLFSGDVGKDALNLCNYIDAFYARLGESVANISVEKVYSVVSGMEQDCPYALGIDQASPFKKAASFTCNLVAERPILSPIAAFQASGLAAHQNAIVAFCLSLDMLHGATIHCPERGALTLTHRIRVSEHFFKDAVNALAFVAPVHHFSLVSLLYESLAYATNPQVAYDAIL